MFSYAINKDLAVRHLDDPTITNVITVIESKRLLSTSEGRKEADCCV